MVIRSVVCVVNKSLTITGGYSGTSWVHNPASNLTTIDGQNQYRGVYVHSTGDPTVRLTMQDFTIQNGRALGPETNSPYEPSAFGGGMSVENAAVSLDRVVFDSNRATGANTNTADTAGGAAAGAAFSIRSSPAAAVSSLTNVRFISNISTGGTGLGRGGYAFGALFVYSSEVDIADAVFSGNQAVAGSSAGSGMPTDQSKADALGGAVAVEYHSGVTLTRVYATSNETTGGTGANYGGGAFGGAVFVEDSAVAISGSYFGGNIARGAAAPNGGYAGGGGVLIFNSNGSVTRSQIIANQAIGGNSSPALNSAGVGGGGLYLWRGSVGAVVSPIAVSNTVIAANSATRGTGINIGGGGGGVQVQGLIANLSHVTLAGNRLFNGLYVGEGLVAVQAPGVSTTVVNLDYSIVSEHATVGASAVTVVETNTANFNKGIFSGNSNDTNIANIPVPPGAINGLGTMTTLGSVRYVALGAPDYDYHILQNSLARDNAVGSGMAQDMDNQGRVDGFPDLGADEYSATAAAVQFSSATYSASETGGSVVLLVERVGGSAGAVTVNYSSTSGTATSGADFTPTSGSLSWESGEAGTKVVVVPILDDASAEGNETFTLSLNSSVGIALGSPVSATVTILDNECTWTGDTDLDGIPDGVEVAEGRNPCAKDNDIFTVDRLFAMQQYRDFLSREGDSSGILSWTANITSGSYTRAQVVDSFFNSPEFGGVVPPVVRLYFAYFLRIPDYSGLMYWLGQYRAGLPLASISNSFSTAPEFIARYGSLNNGQFVTLVYSNVLGRAPDPTGYNYWVAQLDTGAMTRGQVMLGFSESPEYQARIYNSVYVTMMYVGMLRRSPEQLGFDVWVANLDAGMSGMNLINGFVAAPEYYRRFL